MIISPNNPRDYNELVQAYKNKYGIDIESLIKNVVPSELIEAKPVLKDEFLVIKATLALNIMEYGCLLKLNNIDERILYLYKLLIYDYFDYCQSYSVFCGIQKYSVARSLCNHSRIFILCLCDNEFLEYYTSEYTESEKVERYYKKRETNISKKLTEIALEAKKKNSDKEFYAESTIFNLTTELYKDLTDKLGELSHLTEITLARKFIPTDEKLIFYSSDKQEQMKFCDEIIEYLLLTTLTTSLLFIAEGIEFDEEAYEIYNFLCFLREELFKFRNVDMLLNELAKKVRDIMFDEND